MSLKGMIEKVIGTYSDRALKKITPVADKVMALEAEIEKLSDEELRNKTFEFKERLAKGETLDDILPEAFAVCREASWRVLGMKHFYVQVIGGIVLHQGRIAEMKTGEGKTLVATLAAYLNALTGKGVHVVTVNDYLAKRDSEWMGKLYNFLGLTVGLIISDMMPDEKKDAYNADITYGTNNEMGFDYLRDNMVIYKEERVQRGHVFAIVDEVDSILIDEARTPLIISGIGQKSNILYQQADAFVKGLSFKKVVETNAKEQDEDVYADVDYVVDEKARTATLTPKGVKKAEEYFGIENLTDPDNMLLSHHINQAVKAYGIMHRDTEYVVKDGQVLIVDEFTGRIMFGRRYSDGLHQAIEAKEHVKVENESRTLATITLQNYFRMYEKLSGMTGTAQTEEDEFQEIYSLDVVVIPTNKPLVREDLPDAIFKNEIGKLQAVIREVEAVHAMGQPVLIGTVSIEKSELLSKMLKMKGIKHNVLNAKFHEKEAEIVAQAGKLGAVTIATNMAGRGTDIILGGNAEFMAKAEMAKLGYSEDMIVQATGFSETGAEMLARKQMRAEKLTFDSVEDKEKRFEELCEDYKKQIKEAREKFAELNSRFKEEIRPEQEKVLDAGGLYIMGTERHESRRIDNQLRGRAGRQGDKGKSKFFLALDDDLMRIFAGDKINRVMEIAGFSDDEALESRMVSGVIETAQSRVEGRNFDIRKHVLEYDNVNNQQREMIYGQRNEVLDGKDIQESIKKMIYASIDNIVSAYSGDIPAEEWEWDKLKEALFAHFYDMGDELDYTETDIDHMTRDSLTEDIYENVLKEYENREELFGKDENGNDRIREAERIILLKVVDMKWMDHIDAMEQLKQGINLRAYAQKDPVVEYKFEAMDMFEEMIDSIKMDTTKQLFHIMPKKVMKREQVAKPVSAGNGDDGTVRKKPVVNKDKVGRNDPCPCGSGKKYKNCCLNNQ